MVMVRPKRGRVIVSGQLIEERPETIAEAFSKAGFLPLKIRTCWGVYGDLEYMGFCAQFDEIDSGAPIPRYLLTVSMNEDGSVSEAKMEREV